MTVTKKAYAKINLTLEILGTQRGDGFHDIASVMMKAKEFPKRFFSITGGCME